jgi:Zn-dependent peptidase ImmA (M78 family)/DNA-binding XRE family transcriptional regulator
MADFSSSRLRLARARRILTQKALASLVGVTPRSIGLYESGEVQPSSDVVVALAHALRFPIAFFYDVEIDRIEVPQVSFRALSRLRARDRDAALAAADLAVMLGAWFERHFELPELRVPDFAGADPEDAAQAVRMSWGLGEGPVPNVVHLLEAHGVRVFSLAEGLDLDGVSFWASGRAFVLLNTVKSAERSRLDAAHELGHLVLHRHEALTRNKDIEREAKAFAAAFLMPPSALPGMVTGDVGLDALVALKHYWGASAAAVAFWLRRLELISDWNYRWLFREMGVRGWRTSEPEPLPRERSQVYPKVFEALSAEGRGRSDLARELNIPLSELESLVFGLGTLGKDTAFLPSDPKSSASQPSLRLVERLDQ